MKIDERRAENLELANTNPSPVALYSGTPFCLCSSRFGSRFQRRKLDANRFGREPVAERLRRFGHQSLCVRRFGGRGRLCPRLRRQMGREHLDGSRVGPERAGLRPGRLGH